MSSCLSNSSYILMEDFSQVGENWIIQFDAPKEAGVMQYCAIIGDIVGSRKLKNRFMVQQEFLAAAELANCEFREYIESAFTVTIGDEFQVLLRKISAAPRVIEFVKHTMSDVEFLFGVGIGGMATEIKTTAIGMDGPAFHFARKALERAKKRKRPSVVFESTIIGIEMLNALQFFIESCEKRQSKRQKEAIYHLRRNLTQDNVAEIMGIRQQSVHDLLANAYWTELEEAREAIAAYLEKIEDDAESRLLTR
ncbi:MAG: SatD family (SatD) [Firmicutes bacterium]|nr:SatD family (SatD) [Bacillota bacterium]